MAAVLSERVQMVCSRMSWQTARMSAWQTMPSCSRLELVREPPKLVELTKADVMEAEKGARHRRGGRRPDVSSQTPPMPVP